MHVDQEMNVLQPHTVFVSQNRNNVLFAPLKHIASPAGAGTPGYQPAGQQGGEAGGYEVASSLTPPFTIFAIVPEHRKIKDM